MPPSVSSASHICPANGPLEIASGVVGELAISFCGNHTAGGDGRFSLKRLACPPSG
jgi:hypothetical protein